MFAIILLQRSFSECIAMQPNDIIGFSAVGEAFPVPYFSDRSRRAITGLYFATLADRPEEGHTYTFTKSQLNWRFLLQTSYNVGATC